MQSEEEIYGAIARGWCDERNSSKGFDVDLADAIAIEVLAVVRPVCAHLRDSLDVLAVALTDEGHTWTNKERSAYELGVQLSSPESQP